MTPLREIAAFGAALAALIAVPLGPALVGARVLSPSDLAFVQRSFARPGQPSGLAFEPGNRLLTDPMLQFEPWIEFNRAMIRQGRLPLWNGKVGCGAPHLANGQSAVFDPFLAIAYLGPMPGALAWIAAARLWIAGLGMFVLARGWGLGPWGRWFAGLCFPTCGFLTLWLLYPLASVAAWLPWLIAATERLIRRGDARSMAVVASCVALALLGGHVQTGAHCLMLASCYVLFRVVPLRGTGDGPRASRTLLAWSAAMGIGVATAAVAVVPLGAYLSRSPAWEDRAIETGTPWTIARPRVLEAACTALPNLLGNQRRGFPNLARALGANNQNEAAGGFAGLGTLIWLAPIGVAASRGRLTAFLAFAAVFGACASFRLPPVDNLLRALPVLDVIDHRRMTLWVAFGLVGLGAIGLDRLHDWSPSGRWRLWIGVWTLGAAAFAAGAAILPMLEGPIRERAMEHYDDAASRSADLGAVDAALLADRQVRNLIESFPTSLLLTSANLAVLAALASWAIARRGRSGLVPVRSLVVAAVLVDLTASMWGANPMIAPADYRPSSPVIEHLRREAPPPARILGVGAELPPNMLMRYGLADVRVYDAIEPGGLVEWLAPLFEPSAGGREARTSRREITWEGVSRAEDRLRVCGVAAVVGASPPPGGLFDRVVRIGPAWVGHWDDGASSAIIAEDRDGRLVVAVPVRADAASSYRQITLPVTFAPGWRARCDRGPLAVTAGPGPLLAVEVPAGVRRVALEYDPPEVRLAIATSLVGLAAVALLAGRGAGKNGTKPLGSAPRLALESVSKIPGGVHHGTAPQSEGRDADGPLHV